MQKIEKLQRSQQDLGRVFDIEKAKIVIKDKYLNDKVLESDTAEAENYVKKNFIRFPKS